MSVEREKDELVRKMVGIDTLLGKLILTESEDALVGIVMSLTGGSANPAVVRAQIRKRKESIQ